MDPHLQPEPHPTDCIIHVTSRERPELTRVTSPSGVSIELHVDQMLIPLSLQTKIRAARSVLFSFSWYPDHRPDEELYYINITREEALVVLALAEEN